VRAAISDGAREIYRELVDEWMDRDLAAPGDHMHLEFYPDGDVEVEEYVSWVFVVG
jgi:hypothetical protein